MDRPDDVKEDLKTLSRTDWAEQHVEMLMSIPFVSEFVFRSPRLHKNQREVADFLISQGEINIVFSQKCQDDPTSRTPDKNMYWVLKEAKHAVSQLQGGIKKLTTSAFYCDHPRRKRVEFSKPLANIAEGIVLVETITDVDLNSEEKDLPLEYNGTPITYLSVNDFLNLVRELRTVPEFLRYLKERRALPEADLRIVGRENDLCRIYLSNDRHFDGCGSRSAAQKIIENDSERVNSAIEFKRLNEIHCQLLERVAHELSTRDPNLPSELQDKFEPIESRSGYLKMQLAIADLELPDRIYLGEEFFILISKMGKSNRPGPDLMYGAFHSDAKPDWVFVFGCSKGMDRKELIDAMGHLGNGALAHFKKRFCLTVADRDNDGFEVAHLTQTGNITSYQKQMGEAYFANLKMFSKKLSLSP